MKKLQKAACIFFLTVGILILSHAHAQHSKPALSGMALAGTDGKAAYVTLGGPGVKWKHNHVEAGVYMLPSLRMLREEARLLVTPTLGCGILVRYKMLAAGIPVYYDAARQRWQLAGAIGIALGK